MWKTWYTVSFYSENGVWVEIPRTDSSIVAAEVVQTLLKCVRNVGDVIHVNVVREQIQGE